MFLSFWGSTRTASWKSGSVVLVLISKCLSKATAVRDGVGGWGREASMEWDGKEKLKDKAEKIGTHGEDFALMATDL